jgi:Fur family peroxide stress response transcriptional regulator
MYQHRVEKGFKLFKINGLKVTPQRKAIMEYLATSESHPTADDIFNELTSKFPNISNATVYNNLKCLKKFGIINELTFGQTSSRYEWTTSLHYHVVCISCGKLRDFNYPRFTDVEEFAEAKSGYTITRHHFEIYGTCTDCNYKNTSLENREKLSK